MQPLAPTVNGPILPSSTHVLLSGVLAGAAASVFADDQPVGETTAASNGNVWVPLDRNLEPSEGVTASQEVGGEASVRSSHPLGVIDFPIPLPPPVFASPVTECMDHVLLAALVPGATVTLTISTTVLASFTATGTTSWVGFDPSPISAGQQLAAVQEVDAMVSAVARSEPLASVSMRELLPVPVIAGPLHACETTVLASSLIPAGSLELENEGSSQAWVNIAETFWATGVHPLQEGELRARQTLPGCGGESDFVTVPVGPATTPPAPVLWPFCPEARRIVVSGLRPGGVLSLSSRVWNEGAETETEIGSVGIGASTQQVDLPHVIGGSGDVMAIVARQTLCSLTSPPASSLEFARPGSGAVPPPRPAIVGPLFDCMRAVPADKLFSGVLTHVVSVSTGAPLSEPTVFASPTTRIPLWFPLTGGDKVEIRQVGCSAPARSANEPVQPLPSPLPTPTISGPVRPGERAVRITGCLPGSRVLLLVDWQERAATDQTWTGEATVHLSAGLVEGDELFAVQVICSQSSIREGPTVVVAKGRLQVAVAPNSAPGGKATSFSVTATDIATGSAVPGQPVVLGGAPVGVTGSPFGWTPPTTGTSVTGTVQGGTAYGNAGFSIAIRQAVPLTLNLFPGPVAEPNKAWQTDVVWTVTPRWGDAPVVVNGNVGTAMVPPPMGGENRVSVSLAFKAHLQGEIGGIVWQPEVIELSSYLADVAFTGVSHALTARFWFQATDVPVVDDEGVVTHWETKLAAGAHLFSIT